MERLMSTPAIVAVAGIAQEVTEPLLRAMGQHSIAAVMVRSPC
jgi:hypothetical protein